MRARRVDIGAGDAGRPSRASALDKAQKTLDRLALALLQANNADVLSAVLAGNQTTSAVEQVEELAAVDLKEAHPDAEVGIAFAPDLIEDVVGCQGIEAEVLLGRSVGLVWAHHLEPVRSEILHEAGSHDYRMSLSAARLSISKARGPCALEASGHEMSRSLVIQLPHPCLEQGSKNESDE